LSDKYWNGEWPNLNSVSLTIGQSPSIDGLSISELGILVRLVWAAASQAVHTQFSEACIDPSLPDDDAALARMTGCALRELRVAKPAILRFFKSSSGRLRLVDQGLIRISRPSTRSPIPRSAKVAALMRDGRCCVYCGDTDGPFHFDHLFPVSRGGPDTASNIVVACAACNLSKRDKTLAQWAARS